jgi:hypothetical protein
MSELQHQVTLKTSSLQNLTANHAVLSESLQSEKLRCKAIERKLENASRESQELLSRNQELVEQLQELELQLNELIRKRESEQVNSALEKKQWGRMLEMESRLQTKSAEERQKLVEQISALARQVATREDWDPQHIDHVRPELSATHHAPSTNVQHSQASSEARSSITTTNDDSMKLEFARQDRLVTQLISALNEVTQRSSDLGDKARQLVEQSSEIRSISAAAATMESSARAGDISDGPVLQRSAAPAVSGSTIFPIAGTNREAHTASTTQVAEHTAAMAVAITSEEVVAQDPGSVPARGATGNLHAACSNHEKIPQSESYYQGDSSAWVQPLDVTWSLQAVEHNWHEDQLAFGKIHRSSMGSCRSILSDSAGAFSTASSPSTDVTVPGPRDELAASNTDNYKPSVAMEILHPHGDGFYNGIFKHLPARPVLPRQMSANDHPYRGYDAIFRP